MNPHYRAALPVRLYESESSADTVAARFGLDPASMVDFSLNINPLGPPRAAMLAAQAALQGCHQYPDLRLSKLRRALAHRHDVDEDAILFGAGLDDVIKLLVHALSSEGGAVVVHLPTFPRYELEARLRGARVVAVENDPPWTVNRVGIEGLLQREHVELAFLCTPNNPTGEVLDTDWLASLVARHPDCVFVIDEALIEPRLSGAWAELRGFANAIVLRTFSKYYGLAGVRIGYAIGPAPLLRLVERGRPPFNVSHAADAAALAALDDIEFIDRCTATFESETGRFRAGLAGMRHVAIRGGHANMLLLEPATMPVARVVDALGAQGCMVADAACFGGLGGHAAIRISLQDRAANDRLLDALRKLG